MRLVVHVHARPAGGDAIVARWPVSRADSIEDLSSLSLPAGVIEPGSGAVVIRVDARLSQTGNGGELRAAVEHAVVAVIDQRRGGQHGRSGQGGAAAEHLIVAVLDQRRGGQLGRSGQAGAEPEHLIVAFRC